MVMRTRIQLGLVLICCIFFSDIRRGLSAPISPIPQHGTEPGWHQPPTCVQRQRDQGRRLQELDPVAVQRPPVAVVSCLDSWEFLERQQARPESGVAGVLGLSCGGNRLCNDPMSGTQQEVGHVGLSDYSVRQRLPMGGEPVGSWTPEKRTPLRSFYEGTPLRNPYEGFPEGSTEESPLQNLYEARKIPLLSYHQAAPRATPNANATKASRGFPTQTWFNLGLLFLVLERLLSRI